MPEHSIKGDLQDFVEFATRRIELGKAGESIEDLVQQRRSGSGYAEAVADVPQGLVDEADGRAVASADAFAEVRRQLGIAE